MGIQTFYNKRITRCATNSSPRRIIKHQVIGCAAAINGLGAAATQGNAARTADRAIVGIIAVDSKGARAYAGCCPGSYS